MRLSSSDFPITPLVFYQSRRRWNIGNYVEAFCSKSLKTYLSIVLDATVISIHGLQLNWQNCGHRKRYKVLKLYNLCQLTFLIGDTFRLSRRNYLINLHCVRGFVPRNFTGYFLIPFIKYVDDFLQPFLRLEPALWYLHIIIYLPFVYENWLIPT